MLKANERKRLGGEWVFPKLLSLIAKPSLQIRIE
jgi:hypothetical protein